MLFDYVVENDDNDHSYITNGALTVQTETLIQQPIVVLWEKPFKKVFYIYSPVKENLRIKLMTK